MSAHYQQNDMPHVDGVSHHFTTVNGIRIHYAEAGSGDPVVLLHGWPQHWWSWRHLIGPLAEHYRVICPDLRGLGWSEAPRTGYSVWDLTADLIGLLDKLGLDGGVRLAGHDWGSLAAYQAALDQPERFERLAPMGGVHLWSAKGSNPLIYLRPWHLYLFSAPGGRLLAERTGFVRWLLDYWSARPFDDEVADVYVRPAQRPGSARAVHLRDRSVVFTEIAHYLRAAPTLRLRVPTLHLNGEHDPLSKGVPHSYMDFADDMRLEVVPDAGHFIADENPAWVADRLLRFLR
jgi:pimeloyl-ACP methyl ester carboxylesterase